MDILNINNYENEAFVYGLVCQETDEQLYNYIINELNQITNPLRILKLTEWQEFIEFIYEKYNRLNEFELKSVINNIFDDVFLPVRGRINKNILLKSIKILSAINCDEAYKVIGDGKYIISDFQHREELYNQKLAFYDYSDEKQLQILSVYNEYLDQYKKLSDELFSYDGSASEFDYNRLEEESVFHVAIQKIYDNHFIQTRVPHLKEFYRIFKEYDEKHPSGEFVISEFESFVTTDNNIRNTAYFLHYILLSMSVPSKIDTGHYNIRKIATEKLNVFVSLLCALTSKDETKLKDKSNSYYKAIIDLFKFDNTNQYDKERVLNTLSFIKELLLKYNFKEAIGYLDSDYQMISQIIIQ